MFWAVLALSMQGAPVMEAYAVSPDTLGVRVRTGQRVILPYRAYVPQSGDQVNRGAPNIRWIIRNGTVLGSLVGVDERNYQPFERIDGRRWEPSADPTQYKIVSREDPDFRVPVSPRAVDRKSKPRALARTGPWVFDAEMDHRVYLKLPVPMKEGKRYTVRLPDLNEFGFRFSSWSTESEAVHVNQVGFRPDDPSKTAFLSLWKGTGGGHTFPDGLRFRVVEVRSMRSVFQGVAVVGKRASETDEDNRNRNYAYADVHRLEFGSLDRPGVYRVCVEGVGCSPAFPIQRTVWRDAFVVSARGFYIQRSGAEKKAPYSSYRSPLGLHPDAGTKVFASTTGLVDTGNGLNALGTDKNNFGNLVKGATNELVSNAWGGYHDAGDWDTRIQHLEVSRHMFELAWLLPGFVRGVSYPIPKLHSGIPDLLQEACWNLDHFRRMQTPEGGIRGGVEMEEHPIYGETSWINSLKVLTYAPDPWASFIYAGDAARAAWVLRRYNVDLAEAYQASAIKAYDWAVNALPNWPRPRVAFTLRDVQNLAAVELYRLTEEARFRDDFLATNQIRSGTDRPFIWQERDQRDAQFVAATLRQPEMAEVRAIARAVVLNEAERALAAASKMGFAIPKADGYRPLGFGTLGSPVFAIDLVRGHALTQDRRFLGGIVLGASFGAGGNPSNVCFTSGVTRNQSENIFHIDSRYSGQRQPDGLTAPGPLDPLLFADALDFKVIAPFLNPSADKWPAYEMYCDSFWNFGMSEFTVNGVMSPVTYVWGYLAGRK